jgi:hypothetical protein
MGRTCWVHRRSRRFSDRRTIRLRLRSPRAFGPTVVASWTNVQARSVSETCRSCVPLKGHASLSTRVTPFLPSGRGLHTALVIFGHVRVTGPIIVRESKGRHGQQRGGCQLLIGHDHRDGDEGSGFFRGRGATGSLGPPPDQPKSTFAVSPPNAGAASARNSSSGAHRPRHRTPCLAAGRMWGFFPRGPLRKTLPYSLSRMRSVSHGELRHEHEITKSDTLSFSCQ